MYIYDHMGIPTKEKRKGERYVPEYKMYVSGYENSEFRIQWHRFDEDCDLPEIVKTVPHVAFRVDDIDQAIKGKKIIMEPYYPLAGNKGYRVAIIEDGGAPIEFIQTNFSEEEIITRARARSIIIDE